MLDNNSSHLAISTRSHAFALLEKTRNFPRGLLELYNNIMTWEKIGEKARARLDASIPSEWRIPENKMPAAEQTDVMDTPFLSGLFSEREISITTSSATNIVDVVAKGVWKAEEVTRAFCKRAAVAHQLVCLAGSESHKG